ncbi:MAG: cell wall-binding repeat-containing protein [Desulfitobacterium sp.]|nr:cell wall-binding repeat-containing protein [Desulfitobacterium sp.]
MDKNLVDALAAAPLAKLKNAPILLTQGDVLNTYAEGELKRLGVKTVYVTAGEQVITKKVLERLAELKIKVIPLGGKDRFETAVNLAKEMGSFNKIVVATAGSNADALSISSIAAAKGMPILLSEAGKIPTQVKNYIDSIGSNVNQTYILGGEGVSADAVKNAVPNGIRIGGKDRFETNLEILKFFANDLKYSKVYLANGEDKHLVDALTGAPLAAQTSSPLLLTGKALPGNSKEYAKLNLGPNVIALGGESSVAKDVLQELQSSLVYSVDGMDAGSADPAKVESLANTVKITGKNVSLKNAKTNYSVYIHGDNALLDNVTIGGTLFIDPGAHGTANINNVKAGKIVVLSGAKESIHLRNTKAGTLLVSSSSEVRVESSGTTRIGNTVVNSYVILDAAGGTLGTVEVVSADGQEPVVILKAAFNAGVVYESAKWVFSTKLYDNELEVADFDILKEAYLNHGIFRGYTEITDDEVYKGDMKAFEVFEELSDAEKEILIAYLDDTFDANDGIVGNAYRINTVFEEMRKWELESAIWVPESGLSNSNSQNSPFVIEDLTLSMNYNENIKAPSVDL